MNMPRGGLFLRATVAWMLAWTAAADGQTPRSVAGIFSGASQMSHWYSANGDTVDSGFTGRQSAKSGLNVWEEELRRYLPRLNISTGYRLRANTGFVGIWWTMDSGLTADGMAVRDGLIRRMNQSPDSVGFVCHMLASAAHHEGNVDTFGHELEGYARALKEAVDTEFGIGRREFTFWWVEPGNRYNHPVGGQGTAAARRRQPRDIAELRFNGQGSHSLPYFHVTSGCMAYVIADWVSGSGDGTHYTRAGAQRVGRQLAYSMLLRWQAPLGPVHRELRIDSAWRDPEDPRAFIVRVLTNGGNLIGDKHPCRVSRKDGSGVDVGTQGNTDGGNWSIRIDNRTSRDCYSLVRMAHHLPLPPGDLYFSHTWGTWHPVTPGKARDGYVGPLAVWHEDVEGGQGMTQDFADLTAPRRPVVMALGSHHLIPIRALPPEAHSIPPQRTDGLLPASGD